MPKPDAKVIFGYAESFAVAADRLAREFEPQRLMLHTSDACGVAPIFALDSFALELYLKCLYVIDYQVAPKRGHRVVDLFEQLKDGTKKSIRYTYNQTGKSPVRRALAKRKPPVPSDLDSALAGANKVFEKTRYLYEGINEPMLYSPLLRQVVRQTIIFIQPDYLTAAAVPPVKRAGPR